MKRIELKRTGNRPRFFGENQSDKSRGKPWSVPYFFLLLLILRFPAYAGDPQKDIVPPAIIPVSLREPGVIVNAHIRVLDHHIYYFSLRFSFRENDKGDRAKVRQLMGGYEVDKSGKAAARGVPIPVLLEVVRVDGGQPRDVYKNEIDPLLTSWGADHFRKQIGFVDLTPGNYIVQLVLRRSVPDFEGIPVAFSIGYDKFKIKVSPN